MMLYHFQFPTLLAQTKARLGGFWWCRAHERYAEMASAEPAEMTDRELDRSVMT